MRNLIILLIGIASLVAIVECRDRTFKPDVRAPVRVLKQKLDAAKDFNIVLVIQALITGLATCLPPATLLPLQTLATDPNSLKNIIPMTLGEDIANYMATPDFAEIHYHLWNDTEWNDVITFLHDAGWNENYEVGSLSIYGYFQQIYDLFKCPLKVPTGPPATKSVQMHPQIRLKNQGSLKPLIDLLQLPPTCNLWDILQMLLESNLLQEVDLLSYIVREISSDASVHLLLATISEPAKGISFRATRTMFPVKKLITHWNSQFKKNEIVQTIFQFLAELTGINFGALDINVVDNLVSILEFLVWQTPFPVPT